jgi:hypothetical protein
MKQVRYRFYWELDQPWLIVQSPDIIKQANDTRMVSPLISCVRFTRLNLLFFRMELVYGLAPPVFTQKLHRVIETAHKLQAWVSLALSLFQCLINFFSAFQDQLCQPYNLLSVDTNNLVLDMKWAG